MLDDRIRVSFASPAVSGRPLDSDELERERPPAPYALPPLCLRRLQMPNRHGCDPNCPGVQPDGGCLCDVVGAEIRDGRPYTLEIDKDGFWCLVLD